jgi:hypothetical protein
MCGRQRFATTAAVHVADPVKIEVPAPTAELAQLLLAFFVLAQGPDWQRLRQLRLRLRHLSIEQPSCTA